LVLKVVLNVHCPHWKFALFKMFVPLMGLCSTHDFIPICLFSISELSENIFHNLKQNFT
jgi:ABC-type proline/glycine betaine transport system permease subunit